MILFAVMLAALLLSIAVGVSEIAYKENTFGTSTKDTDNAFFAADSGTEQVLFYDKTSTTYPIPDVGVTKTWDGNSSPSILPVLGLGSDGLNCALMTITKNNTVTPMQTTIVSDGFNIGGDKNCNSTSLNRVDREITTTY